MKGSINYRSLLTILNGVWAIPIIIVIRIIRPFLLIRFGTFFSSRIGHFVADSAHQFIELSVKDNSGIIDLYWLDNHTCNKQWETMVSRNLPVYWWVKYIDVWNCYLPGGDIHSRPSSLTGSHDVNGILEKSGIEMMNFLDKEEEESRDWLKDQGWEEGQPFVCLLVRDSAYLENELESTGYSWEYHNYRNSDIDTYNDAMEWLANQGIWVLRMGKKMSKPMQTDHPKIIDYAFHPDKSDLLDIWLFANCNLCISTGSGPDYISDVYRRPILYLNYLPLIGLISWSNTINYPKHLRWGDSGNPLTLKEYLEYGYSHSEKYEKAGIDVIDLTSDEIVLVVQECWKRIEGKWLETDDTNQQDQLWKIMKQSAIFKKRHGFIHPKARLASTFLRNNANFLQ